MSFGVSQQVLEVPLQHAQLLVFVAFVVFSLIKTLALNLSFKP